VTEWGIMFIYGMVLRSAGNLNLAWVWTSNSRYDNHCCT